MNEKHKYETTKTARDYLKNAENCFINDKIEACVENFQLAISHDPTDTKIWFKYINTLISLKSFKSAREVAKQASSLNLKNFKLSEINAEIEENEQRLLGWRLVDKAELDLLQDLLNKRDYHNLEKSCENLIKKFPESPLLYNLIGCSIQDDKRQLDIIQAFEKAIALKPDYVEAMNNYGVALEKFGEFDKALKILHRGVEINSRYSNAFYNLGNVYRKLKRIDEAYKSYQLAIDCNPNHAVAMNNLGVMLLDLGKISLAVENLENAAKINPQYFDALYNLGNAYFKKSDYEKAKEAYQKALQLNDQHPVLLNNFGTALITSGEVESAILMLKQAIKLDGQYCDAYNNLGIALSNSTNTNNAKKCFEKAIEIKPTHAEAHRHLSMLTDYTFGDRHLKQMLNLLRSDNLTFDRRYQIHFALAKAYEDLKQYKESLEHLHEGNGQRKKLLNYKVSQDIDLFKNLKSRAPLTHSNTREFSKLDMQPIFILGMPRSGTTLVEQILSAHPDVSGAGELGFIAELAKSINLDNPNQKIEHSDLERIRWKYISKVTQRGHKLPFFTDKMPHNFRFLNLICAALPEAKIVHVVRTPSATCWSNYKHCFSTSQLEYSYSLEDTILFYNLYAKLMESWYNEYSDRILHLNYEYLVQDPETITRNLVETLGIEWSDMCLEPHNNRRNILTASQRQVRKKIFAGSSKAWVKYKSYLDKSIVRDLENLDQAFWIREKNARKH